MAVRTRIPAVGESLHFVTTTVTDWIPFFQKRQYALDTLRQFGETSRFFRVSVVGYVIMPSHLHALVGTPASVNISKFVQTFKSLSSRELKAYALDSYGDRFMKSGRFAFWKRGFDELQIWSDRQFRIKLEYIHNNPVKARLVEDAPEYEYSSARDWLTDEHGHLEIDKDFRWISSAAL